MATVCASPIKGRVARLTRLDACGVPVIGAASVVVSDGWTRVQASPNYQDGEVIQVPNAWGDDCVYDRDDPRLLDVPVVIDFCRIDPAAEDIVGGARLLLTGADTTGAAYSTAKVTDRFALELWQKVAGSGACSAGGNIQWMYWLYRNIGGGKIGQLTHDKGALTLSMSAVGSTGKLADWPVDLHGDGPWLPVGAPADNEPFLHNVVEQVDADTTPPVATCGATALAAP